MQKSNPTLAIYGIQDRYNYEYPFYVHDHNLAMMKNGEVIHFLQQERISRVKRDNSLHLYLYDLLKEKRWLSEEHDLVFVDNVVGRAFITSNGDARFEAPLNKSLSNNLEEGRCWWFGKEKQAYILNHELAHIFSCLPFTGSFKDNSLLVHFDGGASLSNFSAWAFSDNQIRLVEFHWDLKHLTAIYNANALVFSIIGAKLTDQNSVPGKFMGFAGWGAYSPKIEKWLIENDYFQNIWNKKSLFFEKANTDWGLNLKSFNQKNSFIQDVAATLQEIFRRETVNKLSDLAKQTGCQNLYYTGGCALNIFTNSSIIEKNIFETVFIPPCTEDSGLALGAAAFVEWKKHEEIKIHSPYLNNWNIENNSETIVLSEEIEKIANQLIQNKIIGICNGYGEAGPRALGNRSIIALANSKQLATKISREIKGREWYRPVAPIALEKNVKLLTGKNNIHELAKYMLLDFPILENQHSELEGVIHSNKTARFQAIFNKKDNPFIFELLTHLDKKYNIKALINTSFNANEKPIVHTTEDAIQTAKELSLDGVVINGVFTEL